MADQRISYNEYMVGAGHPTKADTLNRHANVEHNTDGTHKMTDGAAGVLYYHDGTRLVALPAGATTKILVGGGAGAPVWTEATGTGAPVRATSPALVTPALDIPTSGDLKNCTGATTTDKGVTVYSGSTKALAGTDTQSAMTPADVKNKVAVDVNPKAMSQGVAMTYAASGSNGIAVADNDNIDFGTGNFTLVWKGSLPDWNTTQTLVSKWASNHGYDLAFASAGNMQLTLEGQPIYGSENNAFVNGTVHDIIVVVTVGAENTTIDFYMDGLNSGAQQTIANLGSVSTANNLYISGALSYRTASITYFAATYNRALTAAEVLDLYRDGIALADIDSTGVSPASQTALVINATDSMTVDNTANWTPTGATVAFDTDHYELTSAGGGTGELECACSGLVVGKRYKWAIKIKNGTDSSIVCTPLIRNNADSATIATGGAGTTGAAFATVVVEWVATETNNLVKLSCAAMTDTNNIELDDSAVNRIGATLALQSEDIQPSPGQWLDSSGNRLHAMQPAMGSSLTRSKRDFTIKWTNIWAGTHELQYIGGVNQAILPPNCYIDSIIGVIAGETIADIIIGDGSDADRWVTITTDLAAGTVAFTIANAISDGTNYKMTVDPDANFTGSISWTIAGKIL